MKTFPHGYALIINNEQFKEHSLRKGTAVDERNLTHAFRYLGYSVEVYHDLKSTEMLEVMKEMGKRSHDDYDSFVCCILSHGTAGQVCGTDSIMVSLDSLSKLVDAHNCKSLGAKPKLFFLQACRGKMKEELVNIKADSDEPTKIVTEAGIRVATDSDHKIPASADFCFGYATPLGKVAWRDEIHGSWYVAELCRGLIEHYTDTSLIDIMTHVHGRVGKEYENMGYKMAPETTSRLTANVFF